MQISSDNARVNSFLFFIFLTPQNLILSLQRYSAEYKTVGRLPPAVSEATAGSAWVAGCFPLYIKTPQRNWNSYIILCYLSGAGSLRRCGKGAKRSLLISAARSQALPLIQPSARGSSRRRIDGHRIPMLSNIRLRKRMILSMIILMFALTSANLVLRFARARSAFNLASSSGMSLPIMTGVQFSLSAS